MNSKKMTENIRIKKGFTIAEVMITAVVMCTITMICLPTIIVSRPSTEKVLLRKAYNITEQTIAELASNDRFYPTDITLNDVDASKFPNNRASSVFLNYKYPPNDDMLAYSITESFVNNGTSGTGCQCYTKAHNKLSVLFCCSLKTVTKDKGVCSTKDNKTTCDFETIDGIHWLTVDSSQTSTDLTKPIFNITVDVDNKWGGRHKQLTTSGYKKTRFVFQVYYDGKIKVDTDAQKILADEESNNIIWAGNKAGSDE